jgi:hypothetical protein
MRWKHCNPDSDVSNTEDDAASIDELRHFAELRELVGRSPALTSVWFDGPGFSYQWRRLSDGTVDERTACDAGEFVHCDSSAQSHRNYELAGLKDMRTGWEVFQNRKIT